MTRVTTQVLSQKLDLENLKFDESLSSYTTIGIGGPAKYLFIAKSKENLSQAIQTAVKLNLPYYILGNGSNILISDKGFDGLVIINMSDSIKILMDNINTSAQVPASISAKPRLEQPEGDKFYSFADLDYDETEAPSVLVELDSGVRLQAAIYKLISQGITGLQWFAGIPGTIGGATFINAHGGNKFFGNLVAWVNLVDKEGKIRKEEKGYFKFNYDYSILKETRETILSVVLELKRGDRDRALKVAQEWAKRKSLQPQKSLGSTFENIAPEDKEKLGYPTTSTGYIIDKILGFRGTKQIGGAIVSPKTANFIENLGNAKASDVKQIIMDIKQAAKDKIGINLVEEIQYLGDF